MAQDTHAQQPVRLVTRIIGGALVLILAASAVGLYGWPGATERISRGRSSPT